MGADKGREAGHDPGQDRWAAEAAEACFRNAADLWHPAASFRLGCLLAGRAERAGKSRFGDPEARRLFRAAARDGHREAQYRLGEWLYHEYGQTDDDNVEDPMGLLTEALDWLRVAAGRGAVDAQVFLGVTIEEISGLSRDEQIGWARAAAEQGHVESQYAFWANFTHDDPARHAEAVRWLKTAAAACHPEAKAALRDYFEDDHPHDTPRIWMDAAEAEGWYREAVAHKIPAAAEPLLACRRQAGKPTLRSAEYLKRAADEFQAARQSGGYGSHRACLAAASAGHVEAQFHLARAFASGTGGVTPDPVRANKWCRVAAESGHLGAQIELARRLAAVVIREHRECDGHVNESLVRAALVWCGRAKLTLTAQHLEKGASSGRPVEQTPEWGEIEVVRSSLTAIRKSGNK